MFLPFENDLAAIILLNRENFRHLQDKIFRILAHWDAGVNWKGTNVPNYETQECISDTG